MITVIIGRPRSGRLTMGRMLFSGHCHACLIEGQMPILIDATDPENIEYVDGEWKSKYQGTPLKCTLEEALAKLHERDRPVIWATNPDGPMPPHFDFRLTCEFHGRYKRPA